MVSVVSLKAIDKSYDDRMRVMELLISEGIVKLENRLLRMGNLSNIGKISSALQSGNKWAWKFLKNSHLEQIEEKIFDYNQLKAIGDRGERFIVELLQSKLPKPVHKNIEQVSLRDDSLGFDIICPSLTDYEKLVCLEVKTTTRPDRDFNFFITRREYEVSQKRDQWRLVLVRISNDEPVLVGHVSRHVLCDRVPKNADENVSWATLKVKCKDEWIEESLP